jgi:hypothetical protein
MRKKKKERKKERKKEKYEKKKKIWVCVKIKINWTPWFSKVH